MHVVPRRFLEAIAGADQSAPTKGSGRLELARRLVDPSNPLPARVLVNRVWKHHFGEGIVNWGDDILSLTWQNEVGFRWGLKDFRPKG